MLLMVSLAAGCGSSAKTATSPTTVTRCTVTLNGNKDLPAQGGNSSVTVSAARECGWSASADGQWLAIKSGTTGQGDGTVEFTAAANPDPVTRRGAIVLNEQRLELTQGAAECVITLAQTSSSFPQGGGSGRVDVRASSQLCTWTVEPDANWIVLRSESALKGSATVVFDVMPTTGPPRTATIRIAGQRFDVSQAEGCSYSIAPASYLADAAGGSGSIAVTTAAGCPWTAGSNVNWMTISPSGGTGPGKVAFTVAPTSGPSRSGTALVAGETFSVAQGQGCTFSVAPLAHSVASAGGPITVNVTSPAGCTWSASANVPWITLNGPATSSGNGSVTFTVASTTGAARNATLVVAGQMVSVTQSSGCSFAISPERATVPAAGGDGKVSVTSPSGCAWTVSSSVPWIQFSPAAGTGNGDVSFTVAASTGTARSGALTIGGRTFTVDQGEACTFALSANSLSATAAGGPGTVNVTTGTQCAWAVSSNASWVTVTSPSNNTGSGTVAFTVAAETTGASRVGTLTIASQTFTVTQAGACVYTVKPLEFDTGAGDRMLKVEVKTQAGCAWEAISNVPWIQVVSGNPGSGDGEVGLAVAQNDGEDRIGTATIAGQNVKVTQRKR